MKKRRALLVTLILVSCWSGISSGGAKPKGTSVIDTPHNLSVTGGGGAHNIKSTTQGEICVFCHTPHQAMDTPLWSRTIPSGSGLYQPYQSTTMKAPAKPDQPQRGSRLCLSCHDGTIALGSIGPTIQNISLDSALGPIQSDTDPHKNANLGQDLRDDHPISFPYPSTTDNPELYDASLLTGVRLIDGMFVECTSCHDPHNNQYGNFLLMDTSVNHDALCTQCHNKNGWKDADAAHRTGGSQYPTVAPAVAADGCMSCHLNHSAQQGEHLVKLSAVGAGEETNCYTSCHNGTPYSNVFSEFETNQYTHPVKFVTGTHKEDEPLPVSGANKHVECVDCHNPHMAGLQGSPLGSPTPLAYPASTAPWVNGPLRGVRGVDQYATTTVASSDYEFQICFKCHAGGSSSSFVNSTYTGPSRVFQTYDESLRFNSTVSYHPVVQPRPANGANGASLVQNYQSSMKQIYCSDCHDSHGSNEPHMLTGQNYDTYPAAGTSYPLCFRCHDSSYLLDPTAPSHAYSASMHKSHVLDHIQKAPCSACHDPHGVPSALGATTINAAHLVNFDKHAAGSAPVYDSVARSCTVSCHTTNPQYY